MKIIRRKSDNVVVFCGKSFKLNDKGLSCKSFKAPTITSSTHECIDAESIPSDFCGGHYTYTDSSWSRTDLGSDAETKKNTELSTKRKNELSALRYKKEVAGITVAGIRVSTDRVSMSRLESRMNELAKAQVGTKIKWKIPGNGCMDATSDTLKSWHEAASEYTQLCIDRECDLIEALETDIDTDITTGWPGRVIE